MQVKEWGKLKTWPNVAAGESRTRRRPALRSSGKFAACCTSRCRLVALDEYRISFDEAEFVTEAMRRRTRR